MFKCRQNQAVTPLAGASNLVYASAYSCFVYPVGAVVSAYSAGNSVAVFNAGSFQPGDKAVVWRPSTYQLIALTDPIDSIPSSIELAWASYQVPGLMAYDRLINICEDGGTPNPLWDSSRVGIYADPIGSLRIPASKLVLTELGAYKYYHRMDGMAWEVFLNGDGELVGIIEGWDGVTERLNIQDFGSVGDALKASNSATVALSPNQTVYDQDAKV